MSVNETFLKERLYCTTIGLVKQLKSLTIVKYFKELVPLYKILSNLIVSMKLLEFFQEMLEEKESQHN